MPDGATPVGFPVMACRPTALYFLHPYLHCNALRLTPMA